MTLLLGIDIGTSSTKTLLCNAKGKVLATANVEYPVHAPKPGWSEQDPNDWWRAVIRGIAEVCKKCHTTPSKVTGIGLSGQMHGSVFVDRAGRSLRRALLWNDQRTAAECEEIERLAGGRRKLIGMVNNIALTGFTAPKILWVRKHDPSTFEKTYKVLLPKDYIRLRLTGEYASEVSDAAGTLLLDVNNRQWHKGLLGKLRISPDMLPTVHESTEVTGRISRTAAKATGLAFGTPVVGGAGDQPAGAVGNGIVRSGIVSATLGTSGVVFAHSDKPVANNDGNLQSFCHAVPGKWCVFGCMLSAGGSFQWLRNTWYADEVAALRKAKKDPGELYDRLIKLAVKASPGCDGLYFLPYLTGERCPYPDPDARGAWVGMTAQHDRSALIRAVLEGITFGMRDQIEIMRDGGLKIDEVRAGGGGAVSAFWRQLQADIYDATVTTINTQEGAAYGVAILASVGTGLFATVPEACSEFIKITDRRDASDKNRRVYDAAYAQYNRLYPALTDEFKKITALSQTQM